MKGKKTGGRVAGTPNKATADKERGLDLLRQMVMADLGPLVTAQLAHAKGVCYMTLRRPDGTYARATDEAQINAAIAAGGDTFQIFTQAPNVQAFTDLLNRTFGKPPERVEVTGKDDGPLVIQWKK